MKAPFNPWRIDPLFNKHAAGLLPSHRPTAEQCRDWMNKEAPIPEKYHPALQDIMAKMTGRDLMVFRQNCGASMRGFAHLVHESQAFSDIVVHYIDSWSDIGDTRERWDEGYGGARIGV